jgi:hypothetical protein
MRKEAIVSEFKALSQNVARVTEKSHSDAQVMEYPVERMIDTGMGFWKKNVISGFYSRR